MARVHIIGLFHTQSNEQFSTCAFTRRCINLGRMLLPHGHEIIEYSNEGTIAESSEYVPILDDKEFWELKDLYKREQPNEVASIDCTLYRKFCEKLIPELSKRVKKGDIIAHIFGIAYQQLGQLFPEAHHWECGIGYEQAWSSLRTYETHHWQSWHHGKEYTDGGAYEWVCPMGHDVDLWTPQYEEGKYLLFFGRITERKGLPIIKEIAKHTDMKVILCGDGAPELYLDPEIPNLVHMPALFGKDRDELVGGAYAMLCPTKYIEPLCNSGIEAQLCGTPLITTDYGAFSEIMVHNFSGFRCHTLGDFLEAIRKIPSLNRRAIASRARSMYSLESVGRQMDRIVRQIESLNSKGWYSTEEFNAVWERM